MTKAEMKELLKSAIEPPQLCRLFFRYDRNYFYYFPLKVSEQFFLGVEEDDFILDGYSIRRFRDLTKAELRDDKCLEIAASEGLLDKLAVPAVDISSWQAIFTSLLALGNNIIVEQESLDEYEEQFAIGRIEKVLKKYLYFRHFDGDGLWQDEPWQIPYSQITSVTFGSRYVEIFSKYLPPGP